MRDLQPRHDRLRLTAPLTLLALVVALALPAGASADEGALWATVNVCAPGTVGVRANVPGDGTDQQQFVRFSAQWWSDLRQDWLPLGGAADSPWLSAGSSLARWNQVGWNYTIQPPPPGTTFLIRGIATIQWRDGGRVARTSTRVTRGGPLGAGSCRLPA